MENSQPFLFHILNLENNNDKITVIKNYHFIKLPCISEPLKCVLYYFNENNNTLFLLQKNYYNPKIESIRYENEKINKNFISLFINNYIIENDCSYACYYIDVIFIFISLFYANIEISKFMTIEEYINNILKENEKEKHDVIKNISTILKKNVNKIKDRLKLVCDELNENGKSYFKSNIQKIKNFYNLKCLTLFNYIIENKIVFPDYVNDIDNDMAKRYKTNENIQLFNTIKQKKKQMEKYKDYKMHINKFITTFNDKYYTYDINNLRTFIWLIIKGFIPSALENKIVPVEIVEHLNKKEEECAKKQHEITMSNTKNKKHGLQTPKNQTMIESFFKKKKKLK